MDKDRDSSQAEPVDAESESAWFDLSAYRLRLTLVPGNALLDRPNRIRARGAGAEAYAEELSAMGFARDTAGGWSRRANLGLRNLGVALRHQFPQMKIISTRREQIVGRDDDPVQVSYTTVQEHRGKNRVWLEGLRLADAGFSKGTNYVIALDPLRRTITLTLDAKGDRTVSGRQRASGKVTPIVDIANADLTDIVSEGMRLQAVVRPGIIQFTLSPKEAAKAEREARTRANVADGFVTEGTLCAGAGIATLAVKEGVELGGLRSRVDWVVDRDRRYLEVAHSNNPAVAASTRIFEASLEELAPELLSKTDIMQVSLPCTGHSPAGKAKRGIAIAEDHPTDALAIYGALRLIEAVQPSVLISENVPHAKTSASYAILRAYLAESGYRVFDKIMDHTDAGSVESRKRWWMLAISEGLAKGFTLDDLPQLPRCYATLKDAMEPVADDDAMWAKNEYLHDKATRDAAAGKGFKRQLVTGDNETVGTIGRGYHKRRSTEPFIVNDDGLERLLTPIEHARVKGIPESIVRDAGTVVGHEVLGQSILFGHGVLLGQKTAEHLRGVVAERNTPDVLAVKASKGMTR